MLIVDEDDHLLLFLDSDLSCDPVPHWWITPGGGVDEGESDREAAVREVGEETGLVVDSDGVVGPVAVRHVVHGFGNLVVAQDEVFFLLRTPRFTVSTDAHTPEEKLTMTQLRWWPRAELAATADEIWPRDLLRIWALAEDEPRWRDGPVDLGHSQESTVPA